MQNVASVAETVYHLAAASALIVGGGWAWFRFVRHRTLRRRLELSVEGEVVRDEDRLRIIVQSRATNIGLRELSVAREGTGIILYASAVNSAYPLREPSLAEWRWLGSWEVFSGRNILEPSEPVEEQVLIELPDAAYVAIRLELAVNSGVGRLWRTTEVVVIDYLADNNESSETG